MEARESDAADEGLAPPSPEEQAAAEFHIPIGTKLVFSLGDHTVSLALSALAILFMGFLTETAGLRPVLAGAIVWLARFVDGVSDPLMGRISDRTRWQAGRRRPYFLIGALPFAVTFALLWRTPFEAQTSMFVYYLVVYVALSLSMTVVSVPYMALIPEMATGYHERTSLNTFRSAAAVLGTLGAVGMDLLHVRLGGGASGMASAALIVSVWILAPWFWVHRVSWESPPEHEEPDAGLGLKGFVEAARHGNYRRLCAFYVSARIAVDILGLALLFFFGHIVQRPTDRMIALGTMLAVVVLSLPLWLRAAKHFDKHVLFVAGCGWWVALLAVLYFVTPEWPRSWVFVVCGLVGIGYAVADLMPWAMLGEVIDEDRLQTGLKREGLYNGLFTFLRKLGGATAFFVAGGLLDVSGFKAEGAQPASALVAVRALATVIPGIFLVIAIALAWGFPLNRDRHREILEGLAER